MASLMGLTFNIPAVSYEAVPEKLAAKRLGLAIPPYTGAHHIGNTADPVYMGACNGYFSSCSVADLPLKVNVTQENDVCMTPWATKDGSLVLTIIA